MGSEQGEGKNLVKNRVRGQQKKQMPQRRGGSALKFAAIVRNSRKQ